MMLRTHAIHNVHSRSTPCSWVNCELVCREFRGIDIGVPSKRTPSPQHLETRASNSILYCPTLPSSLLLHPANDKMLVLRLFASLLLFFSSALVLSQEAPTDPNGPEVNKVLKINKPGAVRYGGPGLFPMPGGWAPGDIHDKDILVAANFAAEALYPALHPAPIVRSVTTQVVAGLNYNITMDVTRLTREGSSATACSVRSVIVWNHFGVLSLMNNGTINARCENRRG